MPKKTVITLSVLAIGAFAYWFYFIGSEAALIERHSDLPWKLVVKAHREMAMESLKSAKYENHTDEQLDAILRLKVAGYTQ
jgi:hypothetical protein